jgi:hypothetical protein
MVTILGRGALLGFEQFWSSGNSACAVPCRHDRRSQALLPSTVLVLFVIPRFLGIAARAAHSTECSAEASLSSNGPCERPSDEDVESSRSSASASGHPIYSADWPDGDEDEAGEDGNGDVPLSSTPSFFRASRAGSPSAANAIRCASRGTIIPAFVASKSQVAFAHERAASGVDELRRPSAGDAIAIAGIKLGLERLAA